MTRDEALDLIRDKRPTASPNYGITKIKKKNYFIYCKYYNRIYEITISI